MDRLWTIDGEGDNRGKPLLLEELDVESEREASSDGR
jgi:hypothetical protein